MNMTFVEKNFTRGAVLAGVLFLGMALAFAQPPAGEAELPGVEEEPAFDDDSVPLPPPEAAPPPAAPVSREEGAPAEGEEEEGGEETAPEEELVYLNVQDQDIKDVVKQIAKATGRNFILDAKVSGKISILSNKMMTKEEAYQAFLSALAVAEFTTVTGPGGVVKIVPLRDAKSFPIPTHVDSTPFTDSFITRLIKLENINAGDMAEAIKGLISRNGNLFAYPETNTLVLTDSGTNIDRLMKIIKELDQEGPQEVVEIIPIHFATAKELATIVLSLYEEGKKGAPARGGARGGAPSEAIPKVSKIIADERTNAIIVLAAKREIDKVKELINRLDAKLEEGQEGKIHVYYLKYAKAKDVASVLQNLAGAAGGKPGAAGGGSAGAVVAELEDFKIASDDGTNSLLITANAKTYRTLVEKVLNQLDIPRKQVYLEAMVIEFFLSRQRDFGISFHGGGGGASMLEFGQTFGQLIGLFDPFSATNTSSAFLNSPGLLGGILSRRSVKIKAVDAAGAEKVVTVPAFSAFLTALNTYGDTNLVASPNLLALDNEEASIEIIRKEPEPGQTLISATGLSQVGKPERIEAGLRLKLTPQITELGAVRMKIDQQFSSFSEAKNNKLGTQAIVERKVATSVMTNDGQTVVIGGLMEDQISINKTKIPVLGDIPLLGYLFQKDKRGKSKSNLLLFLTPHIIRDSSDFNKVLKRKMGQQQDFLARSYKKKQRRRIDATIREHNPTLFDILTEEEGASDSRTRPVISPEQAARGGGPAIITAKPEDEKSVTIILPASSSMEESTATPVPAVPAPLPAPSTPPPVIQITPKKSVNDEARAAPVVPSAPAYVAPAAPRSAAPAAPTPVKKRAPGHSPVIALPPGTSPDISD